MPINPNHTVTQFLDDLNHPLRSEIERLRDIILSAHPNLTENIKWNGPNYCFKEEDRITMKIQPPKQIQLIFHRGAKKQVQPPAPLINDSSTLLLWKENDRAIASFKAIQDIENRKSDLTQVIKDWIQAAS